MIFFWKSHTIRQRSNVIFYTHFFFFFRVVVLSSVKHDQFMFGKFPGKKEDRETQEMVKNERINKKGTE